MNIYIDGNDSIGWSIDQDVNNLRKILDSKGHKVVNRWWRADVIHNTWWDNITRKENRYMNRLSNRIIVTCSNYVEPLNPSYDKIDKFKYVRKIAKSWIAPSTKQKIILDELGCKSFYLPFLIDLNIFSSKENKVSDICDKYNIDKDLIDGRIIIGSFQRDSLGSDLSMPKWQKGPELLIELLKGIDRRKFVLLLAGPRRHYVISKCKEYKIPYIYIGKETKYDDLLINGLDINAMPDLYQLVDLYLITSKSEGGPKAAIESTAMKRFVMSTDVGLSQDFIDNKYIFNNTDRYKEAVASFINGEVNQCKDEVIKNNYSTCIKLQDRESYSLNLDKIYKDF